MSSTSSRMDTKQTDSLSVPESARSEMDVEAGQLAVYNLVPKLEELCRKNAIKSNLKRKKTPKAAEG